MGFEDSNQISSPDAPTPLDAFSFASVPWRSQSPSEGLSIRLLELAPSTDPSSHLYGSLSWISLDSLATVSFKALSYVWGTGGFLSMIYINGLEFRITNSLGEALHHLRHSSQPLTIWIDQICINQQDGQEKNHQVAQMGKIYQAAEETLVWLGPAESNSDLVMRVWGQVAEDAENWIRSQSNFADDDFRDYLGDNAHKDLNHRAASSFTLEFLNAMIEWNKRTWFSRIWVVQEFTLAPKVTLVCGHQKIAAEQVFLARYILEDCYSEILQDAKNLNELTVKEILHNLVETPMKPFFTARRRRMRSVAGHEPGTKLYQVLCYLHTGNRMKATEPVDLIWGVLGLAVDNDQLEFQPDFDKKDQTELIYTQVARAMIERNTLDMLTLSQFPKISQRLPSWVPDWQASINCSIATPQHEFQDVYAASKNNSLSLLSTDDMGVLGLGGFTVDQIEAMGNELHNELSERRGTLKGYLSLLTEVYDMCHISDMKNHNIYSSDARRAEAKWRVPIADLQYSAQLIPGRAESSYERTYRGLLRHLRALNGNFTDSNVFQLMLSPMDEAWFEKVGITYLANMEMVKNRRPFISTLGYVGMGPLSMQPGDTIVVFKGASVPYIVRQLGEGKWSFVGDCYCDGIMDGENLEARQEQDFYLV